MAMLNNQMVHCTMGVSRAIISKLLVIISREFPRCFHLLGYAPHVFSMIPPCVIHWNTLKRNRGSTFCCLTSSYCCRMSSNLRRHGLMHQKRWKKWARMDCRLIKHVTKQYKTYKHILKCLKCELKWIKAIIWQPSLSAQLWHISEHQTTTPAREHFVWFRKGGRLTGRSSEILGTLMGIYHITT